MKSFIESGIDIPTATLINESDLEVIECDNGVTWTIKIFNNNNLVDTIDMENITITLNIHEDVKELEVYNFDGGDVLGTIGERLEYALAIYDNSMCSESLLWLDKSLTYVDKN